MQPSKKQAYAPYIGITGFTTREQVETVLEATPKKLNAERLLMCGVLVSGKQVSRKRVARYVPYSDVSKIFVHSKNTLNIVHYVHGSSSKFDTLHALNALPCVDGFQLNMVWPDPAIIRDNISRTMRVVLQLNRAAVRKCDENILEICKRVEQYDGLITDVLYDMSGGRGDEISVYGAEGYVVALRDHFPHLNVVVAGGLDDRSVYKIKPLFDLHPRLSVDAESNLRDEQDQLHFAKCHRYIAACNAIVVR